ncbi:MAG TPA: DUF5979 domain-containing protein [Microbacterium sp.]|uniref:DUF5979 domain-containing protein n=1 Tax=Microbacterium sp. TaxID=51671 RepID=UPI002C998D15|nr:DUF5979 domain-containing protein [Microbacterium sp.]HWI31746.1 DUF5979 domain-containing protein [Microbacterium sp.]
MLRSTASRRDRSSVPHRRGMLAVAGAVVVGLVSSLLVVTPAVAADAALTVAKVVDGVEQATYEPGDEFTYTITVGCDDTDCVDAELTDEVPAAFEGFEILGTSVRPAAQPATLELVGCDTEVTTDCSLHAAFGQALDAGGIGIRAGDTYQITLTLKVPLDLNAMWPSNGLPILNTATATATTADPASDTAEVTVTVEQTVDVAVGKTWQPGSQQFEPGVASTIGLSVQNTSNVDAAALALQDPANAPDAAAALAADNPFRLVDFTGFGAVTAPQGADLVAVDAYVYSAGSWTWVTGVPTAVADIALPAGVSAADVGGLRITYSSSTGATIAAGGAAGGVDLLVEQRAEDRVSGTSLVLGATVTNQASATVTVPASAPVTRTASAPYAIQGLTVAVEATKSIAPARIPAGTTAVATIGARNASNGPLATLTLTDADYFTEDVLFDGFTAPIAYPAGAASASVVWTFSDGSTAEVPFANGDTPAVPTPPAGEHLTGFELRIAGAVAQGAVINASYRIATSADLVASQAESPLQLPNTVSVTGTNPAGSATDDAVAPLAVFYPEIQLSIDKRISPAQPVTAGGTAVVQLPTTTATDSAYVSPDHIVIEDVWRESDPTDFWNAFTPIAIAPTQVLSGSTLTIEALTPSGWQTVTVFAPAGSTEVFSGDLATLAPALDLDTVTGLRFTFDRPSGFPGGTTVSPNTVFEARATLRDGGDPTAIPGDGAETYENEAVANATAVVAGGTVIESDEVADVADARIIAYTGDGTLMADKLWTPSTLSSQSGALASTRLGWGVTASGYESVTIADPSGGESTPQSTVFQAFDLVELRPSSDARWAWDSVSTVELYSSGSWQTVAAPGGTWMNASGFKGYTLTAAQSAAVTGMRLTVVPNDAARAASSDPLRPQPGSGVSTSADGQYRYLDLGWRLRNVVRVPDANGPWVTATHGYNDAGADDTVWNTVGVSGVQNGTPIGPLTDQDDVTLIDQPPAVVVTKSADRSVVPIPAPGEVPPGGYPQVVYTVAARNDSTSRASYLRVTDPMPCTDSTVGECVSAPTAWAADPFADADYEAATNPFERLDLTKIAFTVPAGAGVDTAASQVTLWKRAADGSLSSETLSVAAAALLTAGQLVDVVGVSVLYQGTDPASTGGTIATGVPLTMTLTTIVRITLRSSLEPATDPVVVANDAFAQTYDPVLYAAATPNDTAEDDIQLVTGRLDVTASKTIAPGVLIERDRGSDVTVQLEATDGDATVATQQVTIEDATPEFWNRFRLVSLDDVQLPAGADRVQVDARVGDDWVEGVPSATAVLPGVPVADVTGIRFVFTRADGGVFSNTAPPADWVATAEMTVRLLDTVRGTDDPIPFPSTVDNTVSTESARVDSGVYAAAASDAADQIALQTGTFALDVAKTPEGNLHTVEAAETVPWTLTFANSGTGYLTVDGLVDTLPGSLEPDFSTAPTFETTPGGLLSTDVTFTYDPATRALRFDWPDDARRMAPAERFTITLGIVLQPGLSQGQRATNQFVVTTAEPLSACTNTSGNGQGVLPGLPATECGTTNYVEPIPGASLATFKGVKGEIDGDLVDGAVNTVTPGGPCVADAEGYYRSPCAANTVIGATDEWKLDAVNSGTVGYRSLTIVEPLPTPGDRQLATGSARGSTYRPIFDGAAGLDVSAVAGATVQWQVTTAADVCVGTGSGSNWPADPTCASAGWTGSDAFTGDWADVTGLRVLVDFTTTASGFLAPGGAVTVRFQTVNAPATADDPDLGPIDVPVVDAFAWNQFGAEAVLTTGANLRRAPVKAGVTLVGGPIEVRKLIEGPAAAFAASAFRADVACAAAGATLELGSAATVTLDAANAFVARIEGIPLGAECTVAEQGEVGEFGETGRIGPDGPLQVLDAATDGAIPAGQVATITNVYDFGGLALRKTADRTTAALGDTVEYTITVSNTGAIDAENLTVTDDLPTGAVFVTAAPTARVVGGDVEWDIAELAAGESASVTVQVRYESAGVTVNRATVTSPPGPWRAVEYDDPCPDGEDASCAPILVTAPLATTGGLGWGVPLTAALALLAAGLLLAIRNSRSTRLPWSRSRGGSA